MSCCCLLQLLISEGACALLSRSRSHYRPILAVHAAIASLHSRRSSTRHFPLEAAESTNPFRTIAGVGQQPRRKYRTGSPLQQRLGAFRRASSIVASNNLENICRAAIVFPRDVA